MLIEDQSLGEADSSATLKVKVIIAQSCPTLCNIVDCRLPGSSVRGVLQARILEWVSSSGDLPDPEIKLGSPALQASEPLEKPAV